MPELSKEATLVVDLVILFENNKSTMKITYPIPSKTDLEKNNISFCTKRTWFLGKYKKFEDAPGQVIK